uniref:Uncharacterized protein n=1 Tax=viral metagenome TaxID=1070528 RepID=A0A6C0CJI5_9ZZZZ
MNIYNRSVKYSRIFRNDALDAFKDEVEEDFTNLNGEIDTLEGDIAFVDNKVDQPKTVLDFVDTSGVTNGATGTGKLYKKTGSQGLYWLPDATTSEINLVPQTGYYTFPVWAEDNGSLGSDDFDFGFGSSDNPGSGNGVVLAVDCELFAMSLNIDNSSPNMSVRAVKNTDNTNTTYQINTTDRTTFKTFTTPWEFSAGDVINFYAVLGGSSGGNRVCAWFRVPIEGLKGESGQDGERGPTGTPGDFVNVGNYQVATNYNINDVVRYSSITGSGSYVCIQNTSGQVPIDQLYWQPVALDGSVGPTGAGSTIQVYKDDATYDLSTTTLNLKSFELQNTTPGIVDITHFYPKVCKLRTNDTSNVNTSSATDVIWDTIDILDSIYSVTGTNTQIQVSTTGLYEIFGSVVYTGAVSRASVITKVSINGVAQPGEGRQGYLRDNGGHISASSDITNIFNLSQNDLISITVQEDAASGTVTPIAGQSLFIVKQLKPF